MEPYTFLGINGNKELVFFDRWNEVLGGACGITMNTINQEYIDEMNDRDYVAQEYDYLWREAVANRETELGLDDYIDGLIYNEEGLFVGDDPSFRYDCEEAIDALPDELRAKVESIIGVKDEDYAALSCVSCGALFSSMDDIDTSDWLLVADEKNIQKISEKIKNS